LATGLVRAYAKPKRGHGVGAVESHDANQALDDAWRPRLIGRVRIEQANGAIDHVLRGRLGVV
jgi:hypothetical protein